jgi:amino acid permease
MAGPVLNIKIFTKSTAHTLRAISVVTFPPAFFLLLIQGIVSHRVNPAISILPLFFSACFGLLLLANERKCGCQSSGLNGTPIHLFFDILIGIGLLVCLILTWVCLPEGYVSERNIMFGTYCTNFIAINL